MVAKSVVSFVSKEYKRNRKSEEQGGVTTAGGEGVCVCEATGELPTSPIAIEAPLFASCPGSAPGRSSGSHSGAAEDAHAPVPSKGPHPAHHHCPVQSLNA